MLLSTIPIAQFLFFNQLNQAWIWELSHKNLALHKQEKTRLVIR